MTQMMKAKGSPPIETSASVGKTAPSKNLNQVRIGEIGEIFGLNSFKFSSHLSF
jgi:hypothetical protein